MLAPAGAGPDRAYLTENLTAPPGGGLYSRRRCKGSGLAEEIQDQFDDDPELDDEDIDPADEDLLDDEDEDIDDDIDDDVDDEIEGGDGEEDSGDGEDIDDDDEDDEDDQETVTLDALEAEELENVETNDPATILVDEASEIKALRRKEMAIDLDADPQRVDEFVCNSCFLLLKNVQLADPDKALCVDCA